MYRLFDFRCNACSHEFEALVKSETNEIPVCKSCGSPHTSRLISPVRFDIRMGVDPVGNPTMGDKWARNHTNELRKQRAEEREQAHYGE